MPKRSNTQAAIPDSAPVATIQVRSAADAPDSATAAPVAPLARTLREGTKQAVLISMLRSETGATIPEIIAATSWQAHTVRGAMAGALKKKLGLEVTSAKVEERGRVYRMPVA